MGVGGGGGGRGGHHTAFLLLVWSLGFRVGVQRKIQGLNYRCYTGRLRFAQSTADHDNKWSRLSGMGFTAWGFCLGF